MHAEYSQRPLHPLTNAHTSAALHLSLAMHLAQEKNLTRPTNSKGWIVNCFINPNTAIVQVTLPYFIPGQMPGARQARDTVLKVTASRNNDSQVLHFHSEHNDLGEKDVYYSYAPGWTNVSGGRRPRLLCSPAQVCEWVTDAAQCAPLITETKYFIVNKDEHTEVTLEQVKKLDIPI